MYIVTGASAGIGHAIAVVLGRRGSQVLAVARSSEPLSQLATKFPTIQSVVADLSTDQGIEACAAAINGASPVKGIVHSAGSLIPLEDYPSIQADALTRHFRIHVAAPVQLYQRIAARSEVQRMLFIDSYSATTPRREWGAYSIIKSAAQMAARVADQELKNTLSIRVFPGAVRTQIFDAIMASETDTREVFSQMQARGELAQPLEVAEFLTSILVDTTDDILGSIESWDYNDPSHRSLIDRLGQRD